MSTGRKKKKAACVPKACRHIQLQSSTPTTAVVVFRSTTYACQYSTLAHCVPRIVCATAPYGGRPCTLSCPAQRMEVSSRIKLDCPVLSMAHIPVTGTTYCTW